MVTGAARVRLGISGLATNPGEYRLPAGALREAACCVKHVGVVIGACGTDHTGDQIRFGEACQGAVSRKQAIRREGQPARVAGANGPHRPESGLFEGRLIADRLIEGRPIEGRAIENHVTRRGRCIRLWRYTGSVSWNRA